MQMSADQIQDVLTVLSGILHLGNISFVAATGARIADKAVLATAANLFSLDVDRLGDALTQKFMVLRGEEITTPLTKEQVMYKQYIFLSEVLGWLFNIVSEVVMFQPGQESQKTIYVIDSQLLSLRQLD